MIKYFRAIGGQKKFSDGKDTAFVKKNQRKNASMGKKISRITGT